MNIWLRWLRLILTCGLNRHPRYVLKTLSDNTVYVECPRCHDGYYHNVISPRQIHISPNYWDVARGLYDRVDRL